MQDTATISATCIILGDETENDNLSYISLYPNPTTDKLKIAITNSEVNEGTIRLYNHVGQVLFEKKINVLGGQANEEFDLIALTAGIYSLSFQTEKSNFVQKVVKE